WVLKTELGLTEKLSLVAVSLVIAKLSYEFIEKPFRYGKFIPFNSGKKTIAITLTVMIFVMYISSLLLQLEKKLLETDSVYEYIAERYSQVSRCDLKNFDKNFDDCIEKNSPEKTN